MDRHPDAPRSRIEILPAFLGTMGVAVLLYAGMSALQPRIAHNAFIPGAAAVLDGCQDGVWTTWLLWLLSDFTEAAFLSSVPASITMVAGCLIAARLEVAGSRHKGTGVDGHGRIFGRLLFATTCSYALGLLLFGWSFTGFSGWLPTFVPLLVVQPLLMHFGVSPAKIATVVPLGTLTAFPVTHALMEHIVHPLGLPLFVAIGFTVILTIPPLMMFCLALPWMRRPDAPGRDQQPEDALAQPPAPSPTSFFIHRVLGDVGELPLHGSSIGTLFMYAGAIAAWLLNPYEPVYGIGNLPLLLAAQLSCGALAVFIYYPAWRREAFVDTFAGIIFTSAIVTTYANTGTVADLIITIPTVIVGACVFVPLIERIMGAMRYTGTFPAIALVQLGIAPMVAVWSLVLMRVVIPLL